MIIKDSSYVEICGNIIEKFTGIQSKVLNFVDKLYNSVGVSFLFINIPNGSGGRKRFT